LAGSRGRGRARGFESGSLLHPSESSLSWQKSVTLSRAVVSPESDTSAMAEVRPSRKAGRGRDPGAPAPLGDALQALLDYAGPVLAETGFTSGAPGRCGQPPDEEIGTGDARVRLPSGELLCSAFTGMSSALYCRE
jgi:hypothetical protein